jgi:hypothetical protein
MPLLTCLWECNRLASLAFQALPEVVQKITRLENEASLLDSSGEVCYFDCSIHYCASV